MKNKILLIMGTAFCISSLIILIFMSILSLNYYVFSAGVDIFSAGTYFMVSILLIGFSYGIVLAILNTIYMIVIYIRKKGIWAGITLQFLIIFTSLIAFWTTLILDFPILIILIVVTSLIGIVSLVFHELSNEM